jgi:1-acyl-sn-glycerol-3-phosphate acyltransferase
MTSPFPAVGHGIARTGNSLTRGAARFILRLAGWRIDGVIPDLPKLVVCVAPHTSNWDFVIAYLAKVALGLDASWLGKHSLFRGPAGPIMRAMGGIPVNRDAGGGIVEQAARTFHEKPKLLLGVAPEGTRRRVDRWKTGFYHIAREAGVPIWPVALDWGTQTVRSGSVFLPTGNEDVDLVELQSFFRNVRGRRPEHAFPPPDP